MDHRCDLCGVGFCKSTFLSRNLPLSNPHTTMAQYASMTDPEKKQGTLHFKKGKTKRSYTPASAETGHPAYGPVGSGRKVESMLSKARGAGQDIAYDADKKPYRAGYTKETKEPDQHSYEIPVSKPKMEGKLSVTPTTPKQSAESIRQKSGTPMKRRLPRVDWLKGKNKRTESGYGS